MYREDLHFSQQAMCVCDKGAHVGHLITLKLETLHVRLGLIFQ